MSRRRVDFGPGWLENLEKKMNNSSVFGEKMTLSMIYGTQKKHENYSIKYAIKVTVTMAAYSTSTLSSMKNSPSTNIVREVGFMTQRKFPTVPNP